jgi:Flp pilus assembly pilin Flp
MIVRLAEQNGGGSMPMPKPIVTRLIAEDTGQDLAEYGIALAVISILAGLAAVIIAKDVGTLWSQAQNVISSATNAATS